MKFLVLEDEVYTRKFIKKIILENSTESEVFDTSNSRDAVDIVIAQNPQIAILDMELEGDDLNGLEVGRMIQKISPETKMVFVTGHSKYAVSAFEVHPYDYILKPINVKRLIETIVTLTRNLEKNFMDGKRGIEKIVVKNGHEMLFISVDDISYIEKANRKTFIHDGKNFYSVQDTLQELEKKLGNNFLRVHKSYIVNKDKIDKIKEVGERTYEIKFLNSHKVAYMSRTGYGKFKEELKKWIL